MISGDVSRFWSSPSAMFLTTGKDAMRLNDCSANAAPVVSARTDTAPKSAFVM